MCEPLPLFCKTSEAYAMGRAMGREPDEIALTARKQWESSNDWDNENRDNEHLFVLGDELSYSEMVTRSGIPSTAEGAGLDPPEPSRFGVYARRVWDPVLDLETTRLQ
jgi:exodeoxyribonuclease V gamma subunit